MENRILYGPKQYYKRSDRFLLQHKQDYSNFEQFENVCLGNKSIPYSLRLSHTRHSLSVNTLQPVREYISSRSTSSLSEESDFNFTNLASSTDSMNHSSSSSTPIFNLFGKYNFVVAIDLSPSMVTVDPIRGDVLFDRVYSALEKILYTMVQPVLLVPSNNNSTTTQEIFPEICLSVIAVGSPKKPLISLLTNMTLCTSQQTLEDRIVQFVQLFEFLIRELKVVETQSAEELNLFYQQQHPQQRFQSRNQFQLDHPWINSDFNSVVANMLCALDLMAQHTHAPVLILFSDTMYTLSNIKLDTWQQLQQRDVTFCMVNLSECNTNLQNLDHLFTQKLSNYGYVCNFELCRNVKQILLDACVMEYSFFLEEEKQIDLNYLDNCKFLLLQQVLFFKNHWHQQQQQSSDEKWITEIKKSYSLSTIFNWDHFVAMRLRKGFIIEQFHPCEQIIMTYHSMGPSKIVYTIQFIKEELEDGSDFKKQKRRRRQHRRMSVAVTSDEMISFDSFIITIQLQIYPPMAEQFKTQKGWCQSLYQMTFDLEMEDLLFQQFLLLQEDHSKFISLCARMTDKSQQILDQQSFTLLLPSHSLQYYDSLLEYPTYEQMMKSIFNKGNSTTQLENGEEIIANSFINSYVILMQWLQQRCSAVCTSQQQQQQLQSNSYLFTLSTVSFCLVKCQWHCYALVDISCLFFNTHPQVRIDWMRKLVEEIPSTLTVIDKPSVRQFFYSIPKIGSVSQNSQSWDLNTLHKSEHQSPINGYLLHKRNIYPMSLQQQQQQQQQSSMIYSYLLGCLTSIIVRHLQMEYQLLYWNQCIVMYHMSTNTFFVIHWNSRAFAHSLILDYWILPSNPTVPVNSWIISCQREDARLISLFQNLEWMEQVCKSKHSLVPSTSQNGFSYLFELYQSQQIHLSFDSQLFSAAEYLYLKLCLEALNETSISMNTNQLQCCKLDLTEQSFILSQLKQVNQQVNQIDICQLVKKDFVPILLFDCKHKLSQYKQKEQFVLSKMNQTFSKEVQWYQQFIQLCHGIYFTNSIYSSLLHSAKLQLHVNHIQQAIQHCVEYVMELDLSEFMESIILSKGYFFSKNDDTNLHRPIPYEEMNHYFDYIIKKYFEPIPQTNYYHILKRKKQLQRNAKNSNGLTRSNSSIMLQDFDVEEVMEQDVNSALQQTEMESEEQILEYFESHTPLSPTNTNASQQQQQQIDSSSLLLQQEQEYQLPIFLRMECVSQTNASTTAQQIIKIPNSNHLPMEQLSIALQMTPTHQVSSIPYYSLNENNLSGSYKDDFLTSMKQESDVILSTINSQKTLLRLVCLSVAPDQFLLTTTTNTNTEEDYQKQVFQQCFKQFQQSQGSSKYDTYKAKSCEEFSENLSKVYLEMQLLPKHVTELFIKTKKRIQALISKEVLNSLLYCSPISQYVIEKVFLHLQYIPASCYERNQLPLTFIDPMEGQRLFPKLLVKFKSDWCIFKEIGNYFVLFLKRNSNHPIVSKQGYYLYQKNTNQRDSIRYPTTTTTTTNSAFELDLPYWIILHKNNEQSSTMINILFYSPFPIAQDAKQIILQTIYESIQIICKKVNTIILLNDLHDTRLASRLLIPPSDRDRELQSDRSNYDTLLQTNNYSEGQFACPMVHLIEFPLHKRLNMDIAVRTLSTSVFHPFTVSNRLNVFIYREKSGHVFYLRLIPGNTNHCLTLQVYGVNMPSLEITNQLHHLVENKLSTMVLSIISNYLLRNQRFKLSVEDLEFIRPSSKRPDKVCTMRCDLLITPSHVLMILLLLRQNLKTFLNRLYLEQSNTTSTTSTTASFTSTPSSHNTTPQPSALNLDRNNSANAMDSDESSIASVASNKGKSKKYLLHGGEENGGSDTDDESELATDTTGYGASSTTPKLLSTSNSKLESMDHQESKSPSMQHHRQQSNEWSDHEQEEEEWEEDMYVSYKPIQFSFLYNSLVSNNYSSSLASALGKGLACINLYVADASTHKILLKLPKKSHQSFASLSSISLDSLQVIKEENAEESFYSDELEYDYLCSHVTEQTKLMLVFQVWGKGDVNVNALVEKIAINVNQTLMDYILENFYLASPHKDTIHKQLQQVIQQQTLVNQSNPLLHTWSQPWFIPHWCSKDVLTHLKQMISKLEMYSSQAPILLLAKEDANSTTECYTNMEEVSFIEDWKPCQYVLFATVGKLQLGNHQQIIIKQGTKYDQKVNYPTISYKYANIHFARNSFVMITLQPNLTSMEVVCYNWRTSVFDEFKLQVQKLMQWIGQRVYLLNSMLHQKMGIFCYNFENLASHGNAKSKPQSSQQQQQQTLPFHLSQMDMLILNKYHQRM